LAVNWILTWIEISMYYKKPH